MKTTVKTVTDKDGNVTEYHSEQTRNYLARTEGISVLLAILVVCQLMFGATLIYKMEVLRNEIHEWLLPGYNSGS